MWMMGYNDGGEFNNMAADSFNTRKLRPLISRPSPCTTTSTNNNNRIKATEIFALNHHLAATMADQNKREQINSQPVVVSSRWNPTPEQLRALEDLYRRGTRTPSADQIQHITAQLRRYGKIEGKNVFYWFQNHKARERQKRRRQMESNPDQELNLLNEIFERKDTGSSRAVYEVEQTKNWTASTNCSTLAAESVSISRATKAVIEECRPAGRWVQLNEGELQDRRNFMGRNATWHMMQLSSSPPTHHLILKNTTSIASAATSTSPFTTIIKGPTIPTASTILGTIAMDSKGLYNKIHQEEDGSNGEFQTLQLFPLRSDVSENIGGLNEKENETSLSVADAMNASSFTPSYQFYEFLPLKS